MQAESAARFGIAYESSLAAYPTSSEFVAAIPINFARRHHTLGLIDPNDASRLIIALGDLTAWSQLQVIARYLRRPVRPILTPRTVVLGAIDAAYQQQTGRAQAMIDTLDSAGGVLGEIERLAAGREDLLDDASRAPVIKLVNLILFEAVKSGASDVHVQPYEDRVIVRMRIDGVLYDSYPLPKTVQEEVVSASK